MDCSPISILPFHLVFSFLSRVFTTIKILIHVQKLNNVDRKTLVILQLPESPREMHACFIPGFTQS